MQNIKFRNTGQEKEDGDEVMGESGLDSLEFQTKNNPIKLSR